MSIELRISSITYDGENTWRKQTFCGKQIVFYPGTPLRFTKKSNFLLLIEGACRTFLIVLVCTGVRD